MHILGILLILLPIAGWAQQSRVDTLEAFEVYSKADSLSWNARYDSSSTYFKKAAELYGRAGAWDRKVEALYHLSINKWNQDKLDEASRYIEQAEDICQRKQFDDHLFQLKARLQKGIIAETRANYEKALQLYRQALGLSNDSEKDVPMKIRLVAGIGDVYDWQGNYAEAIEEFHKAEGLYHRHHLRDKQLLSRIYNSLGISYDHNGETENALKYYHKSLNLDRDILPKEHPDLAKDYNNMAIVYYYHGDYQRSLEYLKNAVNILRKFYGENHKLVATGYSNVGAIYTEMGKLKQAAGYLEKALTIRKKILEPTHPDIAINYQNLGALYYDMKKYDKAISYYEKAKVLHLKRFPDGHPELANVYHNLGQAYAKKGEYQRALDYYQKDLETNLKFLSPTHPFIGETYTRMGETYSLLENYPTALRYFKKALPLFVKGYSEESGLQNPKLEQIVYPEKLLKTLEFKAGTLHEYSEQRGDSDLMDRSLHTYLQAVQLIEKLQYSLNREGSKFLLRERTHNLYQEGFETAFTLARQTGNADYKEYAFYFAEKSKDQILLEQLQKTNAEHFAGIPDSLLHRGQLLETHLTKLQQKLTSLAGSPQPSDSLKRIALEDSLFHVHRKLESHIRKLEKDYPRYYKLKYRHAKVPSWKVRQHILSPGQTMIEYFAGTDSLYAFVISKEEFHLRRVVSDSLISHEIAKYRQAIKANNNPADFSVISYRLYKQLFEPLKDLIKGKQLLIVPDGPLDLLPFECLVTKSTSLDSTFRTLPYLVNDYTVSYAPSATYLNLSEKAAAPAGQKAFLGFAPVFRDLSPSKQRSLYPGLDRPLSALPLSETEVKDLVTLFNKPTGFWSFLKSDKKAADIFVDAAATEKAFKSLPLSNYKYIHLATHAFVSENHPGQSGIVFSPSKDGTEDGILHASEIYNLHLAARLVTLSACKTGIGKMAKGEGMMSLSRAFQYAGAKDLLVSLWNVDDRSTARLMVDFYDKNEQETPMSRALRDAKRAMIREGRYAQPKFWAPFIFIGQ
jgi:CHAT domain-containing protein/Flp pilus assembly protein TadD